MSNLHRIFAYGSLLHSGSLSRTVPEAANIFPAKVRGLKRVFNLASHYRFDDKTQQAVCVLNVIEVENDQEMNGSCFEMTDKSLQDLLQREKGYELCPIQIQHYFAPEAPATAYYFKARNHQPYEYLANSANQRHYLNLCLQGGSKFGQRFVNDFKSSTSFWGIDCERKLAAIWKGEY